MQLITLLNYTIMKILSDFKMRWLVFLFVVSTVICEEPQCSKFHYEAQMLDKMIRMEVKVEAMEKEILKTNQLVLESLRTLTSDRENAQTEREIFNKDYSELKTNILEEVKVMRDTLLKPSVAFKARGPADLSLETGQTVVFSTIMINEGGAYDNTTGIFTVPVAGTYLFTIHICMPTGIHFYYGLVYDNIVYTSGDFGDADYYKCYTADDILVLKPGKKIWLKYLNGLPTSSQLYEHTGSNSWWNTLSGVLIHK